MSSDNHTSEPKGEKVLTKRKSGEGFGPKFVEKEKPHESHHHHKTSSASEKNVSVVDNNNLNHSNASTESPAKSQPHSPASVGSPQASAPINLAASIPHDVMEKVKTWKVRQAAIQHGKGGKATSKTHPFKPPASVQEALDFLKSQNVKSCTLVFVNNSAMGFADGKYTDFDDFAEDDDDE